MYASMYGGPCAPMDVPVHICEYTRPHIHVWVLLLLILETVPKTLGSFRMKIVPLSPFRHLSDYKFYVLSPSPFSFITRKKSQSVKGDTRGWLG